MIRTAAVTEIRIMECVCACAEGRLTVGLSPFRTAVRIQTEHRVQGAEVAAVASGAHPLLVPLSPVQAAAQDVLRRPCAVQSALVQASPLGALSVLTRPWLGYASVYGPVIKI